MSDPLLFAFGAGVTFLTLAASYVWMRGRYGPLARRIQQGSQEATEA